MNDPTVDVSVVVPAYRAGDLLHDCVRALLAQSFEGSFEVIVVVSADLEDEFPDLEDHPRLRVITHVGRLSAAEARNRGVKAARGKAIAFTDAVARPPRVWLSELVDASGGGSVVVAGAVDNGTPTSVTGTTEYLMEFLDLHPARPPGTAWHGAACNLLFPREIWDRVGPWPDLGGGEDTLLTSRLNREGALKFSGDARTERVNRTGVKNVVSHQYKIGRYSAHLGRLGPYKLRPLVRHWFLAPIAAAGRFVSIYARVIAWLEDGRPLAFAAAPLVAISVLAWGWGLLREGIRLDMGAGDAPD